MFDDSSGKIYEQIENKKALKARKRKLLIKRLIVVSILLVVVSYLIILLIDLGRYKDGKSPLITLRTSIKEYDDGKVTTKYSLGWVFREYSRETIKDNELVPFWKKIRMDDVLNRSIDGNFPEVEKNYETPYNPENLEKKEDILFFYDKDNNILDTYKCIRSYNDCEISYSVIYKDIEDDYYKHKMNIIDDRYVFITEYRNKDTEAEDKTIYLYDINAKRIIAEYEDIRHAYLINDKGYIDSSKMIVKKNGKYGIDQVIKGKVTNYEDYTHTEIIYQEDVGKYIFNDNGEFYAYDAKTKEKTSPIKERIYKLFVVNDKTYMMSKIDESYVITYYKLYNSEGVNVINDDTITYLNTYDKFIIYIKDNKVHVTDYDGKLLIDEEIPLYYPLNDSSAVKSLKVEIIGNKLKISTPHQDQYSHLTDERYYDLETFKLTNKRLNVKETS